MLHHIASKVFLSSASVGGRQQNQIPLGTLWHYSWKIKNITIKYSHPNQPPNDITTYHHPRPPRMGNRFLDKVSWWDRLLAISFSCLATVFVANFQFPEFVIYAEWINWTDWVDTTSSSQPATSSQITTKRSSLNLARLQFPDSSLGFVSEEKCWRRCDLNLWTEKGRRKCFLGIWNEFT